MAELEKVLKRARFNPYLAVELRREFAALVRQHATLVAVSAADLAAVSPSCRDPRDNPFLALAKVCAADVLISSDADLLVLHPWNDLPILTPAAFLAAVAGAA